MRHQCTEDGGNMEPESRFDLPQPTNIGHLFVVLSFEALGARIYNNFYPRILARP